MTNLRSTEKLTGWNRI